MNQGNQGTNMYTIDAIHMDNQSVDSFGSHGTELTDLTSISRAKHGQGNKVNELDKSNEPIQRPCSRASKASRTSRVSRASKHSLMTRNEISQKPQPKKLETKEDLEQHVRQWIQLDNEIRKLQALARERREHKKQITQDLVDVMKENDIDFNLSDGKLVYKESKRKSPLNEKHINTCLMEMFGSNPQKVQEIMDFIISKRETKMVDTVQRRINKGAKDTILKSGHESIKKVFLQD